MLRTAGYALRASACLAGAPRDTWVTGADLSARANIPRAYVSKVMQRLVQAELVEGRRGWHGGYRLAREPSDVPLSDVLAAIGETIEPDHCIFGLDSCDASHACPLHHVWHTFKQGVLGWAATTTLADVGSLAGRDGEE